MKGHIKLAVSQTLIRAPRLLTSCFTAIKKFLLKYCETEYERSGKILCSSIKIFDVVLINFKSRYFHPILLTHSIQRPDIWMAF